MKIKNRGFTQAPLLKNTGVWKVGKSGKSGAGFTLVELLVVISIIGILSAISFYSINGIKLKSRDARRVADVRAIQQGLSMYYNDNDAYPDSGGTSVEIDGSDAMSQALIDNGAMRGTPLDPMNIDDYKYYYESTNDESSYVITFYLETDSVQGKSQGLNTVSP